MRQAIIFTLAVYFFGVFVSWKVNPAEWDMILRIITGALVLAIGGLCILEDYKQ